ncbi:MAG: hypothetical protein ABEJ04_02525 [Halobacteriaceae archaeon]
MVERDLGEATIVYDDPDEGTVERTVENEHVAYFQDHWLVKTGEDEEGNDVVRRIPHHRVHYVERSVEAFEEEVQSVQSRVQSLADNLRERVLGGSGDGEAGESEADVYRVDVESGDAASDDT